MLQLESPRPSGCPGKRATGGVQPEKQMQLALFLASERSNHISGKLIHVNDDWKRLEQDNMKTELYTLRRMSKM